MDFNASSADGFVRTMLVYVATLQLTCVSSGSVVALSRHWLCLCNCWPLKLHCSDKVVKCRNIHAVFHDSIICCEFVATILTSILLV